MVNPRLDFESDNVALEAGKMFGACIVETDQGFAKPVEIGPEILQVAYACVNQDSLLADGFREDIPEDDRTRVLAYEAFFSRAIRSGSFILGVIQGMIEAIEETDQQE